MQSELSDVRELEGCYFVQSELSVSLTLDTEHHFVFTSLQLYRSPDEIFNSKTKQL